MLPKVDLSFKELGQWRRKRADVSISLPQLRIGLIESWKLCLNLCSRRWLKSNLNLVNNLTPLGLWQLKVVLPEGRMKLKSFFLEMLELFELRMFSSSLFHSITAEGKRNFERNCALLWIEVYYYYFVLYVLTEVGIILNRYFGYLYLKILKKQHSFLYHLLFQGFPNLAHHIVSLYVPLIAPVIANAALYWMESRVFGEMKRYMLDHIWCHHSRNEV